MIFGYLATGPDLQIGTGLYVCPERSLQVCICSYQDPLNRTSRMAEMPLSTALTASGIIASRSLTLLATPAHALPPAAALAIPEKSGVGEKEIFRSSFVEAAP